MTRVAALAAALVLISGAAGAASFDLGVDPRIELLHVVAHLAGFSPEVPASAEYRGKIDRRFGAFREHPAVELYRRLGATESREEASATILFHYTDPPELALKDPDPDIHYINGEGEREQMHRLLWELRDFARASGFMSFFREQAPYYERLAAAAREKLGTPDPVAEIETLLGMSISGRPRYVLAPLARRERYFIIPYPLPPFNMGAERFDPYAVSTGETRTYIWLEPLYSFIDPSFYYFEKLNAIDPREFYGAELAACHAVSPQCTKDYVAMTLERRLYERIGAPVPDLDSELWRSPRDRRYLKALAERLEEYERDRARYPTLWSFYPRLMSVFYELAHGGRTRALRVPSEPAVRECADFFDPSIAARLR